MNSAINFVIRFYLIFLNIKILFDMTELKFSPRNNTPGADRSRRCRWPMAAAAAAAARTAGGRRVAVFPTSAVRVHDAPWTAAGPARRARRTAAHHIASIKNRPGNTKPQLDLRVLAQHTPTAPVLPPPSRFSSHGLVWPSGPRHLRTDWHRPLHLSFRHCRWA